MTTFKGDADSVDLRDEQTQSGDYWYTDVQFVLNESTVGIGRVVFIRTYNRPPMFDARAVEVDGELAQDRSRIYASRVFIPSLDFTIYAPKPTKPGFITRHGNAIVFGAIAAGGITFASFLYYLAQKSP